MANILFLAHRLPYPPDKGDKVRSYHLLKHLAARHRVYLGTFVDDAADLQYLPAVRALCAEVRWIRLHARRAKLASLAALWRREPLTLAYYRNAALRRWVFGLTQRSLIDKALMFSSSMAQYTPGFDGAKLVDFVDVDSAKWTQYAPSHAWPLSWLYAREGRTLLSYEKTVAAQADHSFFSTEKEAILFRACAPECASRVSELGNGVDSEYFAPAAGRASPFSAGEVPIVFTGAMDYWPNVDAVTWFVSAILPRLLERVPAVRFHVVGRSPTAAVRDLAGEAVSVSGTVPDVRPYLQHATVVVAPLRLARGIQNKVLEAMAMERPVVAASSCVAAIEAQAGTHLWAASSACDYVRAILALLNDRPRAAALGRAGRQQVVAVYGWDARLADLDRFLALPPAAARRQLA